MRKTLMLGTLIALFGAGTLAQASDDTAIERSATEASQPAAPNIRGEERHARRHHTDRHEEHHAERRGDRHHDDDRSEYHYEDHGRHR